MASAGRTLIWMGILICKFQNVDSVQRFQWIQDVGTNSGLMMAQMYISSERQNRIKYWCAVLGCRFSGY